MKTKKIICFLKTGIILPEHPSWHMGMAFSVQEHGLKAKSPFNGIWNSA